jgi:hypothetical protein
MHALLGSTVHSRRLLAHLEIPAARRRLRPDMRLFGVRQRNNHLLASQKVHRPRPTAPGTRRRPPCRSRPCNAANSCGSPPVGDHTLRPTRPCGYQPTFFPLLAHPQRDHPRPGICAFFETPRLAASPAAHGVVARLHRRTLAQRRLRLHPHGSRLQYPPLTRRRTPLARQGRLQGPCANRRTPHAFLPQTLASCSDHLAASRSMILYDL